MNRAIMAIGVAGVLAYSAPAIPAKAINISSYNDTVQPMTEGLIYQYYLDVTTGNGKLYLNGYTRTNSSMKTIGFTDIKVEYSSDGKNWYKEKSIDDLVMSDSKSYYLNDYSVSVKGGYYYRVKLTHYAKEKGLFGSSQSVDNTSNSVWIDNN